MTYHRSVHGKSHEFSKKHSQAADSKGDWACGVKAHKTQPIRFPICLRLWDSLVAEW